MKAQKITPSDTAGITVSSLPTRPTASTALGGAGMTPAELKSAFDRLPMLIIERFNALIDDIRALGEGSLAAEIPTGIEDAPRLSLLLRDISSGAFASYLSVGEESLASLLAKIKERLGI